MLLAARKLQGIGLVLLVLVIAMTLYPVSLRVAATRSELAQVESDVLRTRLNIRYLETEFSARASLRQLERWNAESLGYAAPDAAQFLQGERALADLDSLRPVTTPRDARMLLAVAVVPDVQPESRSAAQMIFDASIPSAQAREPAPPAAIKAETTKGATKVAKVKSAVTKSEVVAPAPRAPASPALAPRALAKAAVTDAAKQKAQRIAMLDKQLLTPAALNAIDAAARAETGRGQ